MEPKVELYCGTDPTNEAVTNITLIRNGQVVHGNVPTAKLASWLDSNASFKTAPSAERATGTRG